MAHAAHAGVLTQAGALCLHRLSLLGSAVLCSGHGSALLKEASCSSLSDSSLRVLCVLAISRIITFI